LKETSPRQASLDDPPSWQQNEAALCLGVFDDLQLDAMLGRRVGCGRTLNIGQLHAATGDLLDLFGQPLDLGAVLFARRVCTPEQHHLTHRSRAFPAHVFGKLLQQVAPASC
jgi:hypothetical protein